MWMFPEAFASTFSDEIQRSAKGVVAHWNKMRKSSGKLERLKLLAEEAAVPEAPLVDGAEAEPTVAVAPGPARATGPEVRPVGACKPVARSRWIMRFPKQFGVLHACLVDDPVAFEKAESWTKTANDLAQFDEVIASRAVSCLPTALLGVLPGISIVGVAAVNGAV
jgi:hypothetical protein